VQAPDGPLLADLATVYGDRPPLLRERSAALERVLDRFLETHGDGPCAVYRAPARISLNPHCDHQGAWVPYGLHARELLAVVSPADDDRVEVSNVDPEFEPLLSFAVEEEIRRDRAAWSEGWFSYIEAPAVVAERGRNTDAKTQTTGRRGTLNYVKAAALRLKRQHPAAPLPGLRMTLSGNITQGGGQSSSSAIVVGATLALGDFAGLETDRRLIAECCGEAEWYVGTRGGSGDHAAMLLGTRDGLAHLCFRAPFGVRGIRHSPFPAGYQLLVANSRTRSEKSAEERLLFNRGIFAYRFAFLALKEEMAALGLPEDLIAGTESLGDLHAGRLSQGDLLRLLLRLPESAPAAELATRFPETFGAAARGCFGTDDPALIPAVPLRGAAAYGLGRVDRGRIMPELLEQGDSVSMGEFGRLMCITHDGDRVTRREEAYTENRERLSDERLRQSLTLVEAGEDRPLRYEPGFYGASIPELDRMVDAALGTDGVLGAGLMGAGGGGYVLILAREGVLERVRETLVREYYRPLGKEPDVEAWHPSGPACRLL
jgi:N-acetylgalactosamine kinase